MRDVRDLLHRLSDKEHLQQRHGFDALLATAREATDTIERCQAVSDMLAETILALLDYVEISAAEWDEKYGVLDAELRREGADLGVAYLDSFPQLVRDIASALKEK